MSQAALFERPPVRVKACRPGIMMYYVTDPVIGRSLDLYGEFAEGEARLFRRIVQPAMTVLDFRAHIGPHTLTLVQAVGPAGRVIAFEPQRALYQMLCGNLALNALDNVVAHHASLGAASGEIVLPPLDFTREENFGGIGRGHWAEGETVPVVTLDSLRLDRCNFIKLDCDGMEREVLEGGADTLAERRPLLYVANKHPARSKGLIAWLLERDYRLYWHVAALFNERNYFGAREDIFGRMASVNMLAVPRSNPAAVKGLREITSPEDSWNAQLAPATA